MVEVEVTERVTTVAPEENVVYVDVSEQKVNIDVSLTIQAAAAVAGGLRSAYRVAASSFSGTTGQANRTYQFTAGLGTSHIIAAGTATGALTILDEGGFSLATTTFTNDTITIARELFDDEVVTVWL